jgi:sec-independent protein translocase protein TatC
MFLLAFGFVFELPLIMMLLGWAGLVDHKRMEKVRKYAVLVEAVIAMVFTPSQDPLSMALMLIPLIFLYELGIWLARIAVSRKRKRQALAALAEQQTADQLSTLT